MNDSQQAGADVARALGLDPYGMVELNLKFRSGDLLVVDTQQLVIGDRLKKVADEIVKRKFVVREIEDKNAAPVAVPADQRHDAATCCGWRQRPDVGEGWRWLDNECLHPGDMVLIYTSNGDPRKECYFMEIDAELFGHTSGPPGNFRRRVTPEAEAQPDAQEQRDADAWRRRAYKLTDENATLRSEVERLRLLINPDSPRSEIDLAGENQ